MDMEMDMMKMPKALQSNEVNKKNHLYVMKHFNLGPADPTQPNESYWNYMGEHWKITPGDARGRLCANCEHYVLTTPILEMIDNGPAKDFKASDVSSALVDIESKPTAWCNMFDITCSPVRTCTEQEPGGPIDDVKMKAIELAKAANEQLDIDEFTDPFKDTTED